MSLANDVKNDIKTAKKIWLPWWAVLSLIIGGLPIVWLFDHFGKLSLFLPAFNSIAVLVLAIAVKRNLRRYAWFWITISIIAVLHLPLILFIPWGTKWVPALAIAAIDSADFCLILWILAAVRKTYGNPENP